MRCSANEVMTLAAKAARGAGAPPAQAADFGAAALAHLAAVRDGVELEHALAALPKGPVLTFPLAIRRLIEGEADEISADGFNNLALSYLDALPFKTSVDDQIDQIIVQIFRDQPNKQTPTPRVILPDALAAKLHTLAAKILVPESDASRLSGAGAGLTDND